VSYDNCLARHPPKRVTALADAGDATHPASRRPAIRFARGGQCGRATSEGRPLGQALSL